MRWGSFSCAFIDITADIACQLKVDYLIDLIIYQCICPSPVMRLCNPVAVRASDTARRRFVISKDQIAEPGGITKVAGPFRRR
jgi:hypothetical protein